MDKGKKSDLDIQREVQDLRIGARVRKLRHRRSLTLQDVSNISGLSKSLLSQIENDATAPPIATLIRIAKALGVTIGYFFKEVPTVRRISVVRKDERRQLLGLPHNRPARSGYHYQALSHPIANQHMEPFIVQFDHKTADNQLYYHSGEEFIFIQHGQLEFKAGDRTILLETGDSLYFDASIPHCMRNIQSEATALVVIFEPE